MSYVTSSIREINYYLSKFIPVNLVFFFFFFNVHLYTTYRGVKGKGILWATYVNMDISARLPLTCGR